MAANEGMFRRDGGVKKKSGVDIDCVAPAWAAIRNDASADSFAIFTYAGKKSFQLGKSGGGDGARGVLDGINALGGDNVIAFAGFRSHDGKFVRVLCLGEDVNGMKKGRASLHKNAVFNALEGAKDEIHVTSVEELGEKLAPFIGPAQDTAAAAAAAPAPEVAPAAAAAPAAAPEEAAATGIKLAQEVAALKVSGGDTAESSALPSDWTEYFDEASKKPYYVNSSTNETTWERPK